MFRILTILFLLIIVSTTFSCRKDDIETSSSASLKFSTDTILFDTVFTTIGSTTKRLKIYNRNGSKLIISNISLSQGANSQFRINVDGVPGYSHTDVEIESNDSLFLFIEVTVDPNSLLSPFVVEEKINFTTNGNNQHVQLVAWGQNAHYFTPKNFVSGLPDYSCLDGDCGNGNAPVNTTWINDKPYVIYGYLVIDSLDVLKIDPGVRVHLHNNSGIWVYKDGNLRVNGTVADPVTFQGTRLESAWQDVAGQWDRIWINEGSTDNVLNYAVIKNAFIGIQAETLPFNPSAPTSTNKLRLNNCVIQNSSAVGLLATNYKITDTNSIIVNSGQFNLYVRGGGEYQFNHTTIANYWSESTRETPAILLQNYYIDINGATQVRNIDSTNFYNCIVHGDQDIEFDKDVLAPGSLNFKFVNSILKTTNSTTGANYISIIKNPSATIFVDFANNDYHLTSGSPAINNGIVSGVLLDHDGITRSNPPDIGAYEN
jgi:hypothetical protein